MRINKNKKKTQTSKSVKPAKPARVVKQDTAIATLPKVSAESSSLDYLLGLGSGGPVTEENLDFLEDEQLDYNPLGNDTIDIVAMVDEAIEQDNLVSPDLKIDDSSCKEAPNVLSWLIDDGFLGCETPYLEQALTCIKLFAEYCPSCSDTDWMEMENHEPQEGIGGILNNVQMMNFGVCPSCNGRRSDFIKDNTLKFFNELAMLAGQRCVTGDTLVLSEHGYRRIDSWDTPETPIGFSDLKTKLHNGQDLEETSQFFKSKPEHIYQLTLTNGMSIKGTGDHPVLVSQCGADPINEDLSMYGTFDFEGESSHFITLKELYEDSPFFAHAVIHPKGVRLYGNRSFASSEKSSLKRQIRESIQQKGLIDFPLTMLDLKEKCLLEIIVYMVDQFYKYSDLDLYDGDYFSYFSFASEKKARIIQMLFFNAGVPCVVIDNAVHMQINQDQITLDFLMGVYDKDSSLGYMASEIKSVKKSKKKHVTFDFTLPKTHRFIANGLINHNSGKSIVTAMASTYITHRILKMQKPTEVFRVGKGQILHGTFVALTQGQAKDTLWEPFYGYLQESPWFKKYHALLRFYERKYHQEFFKLKDTFVLYRHRGLSVYPSGPDGRRLRGRTRIFAAIDEIGWFDNSQGANKVKIGAQGVYEALVRSLATVRSSEERLIDMKYDMAISGYMLNISSPSSVRDKICELVRSSIGSMKTLGVHAPTWKMNPNITRQSGFLLEEYRKDPVTAQRDYGAEPPLTANPFISNPELVRMAFNSGFRNLIKYRPKVLTIGKEKYRYAEIDKIKPSGRPSVMTLDAGLTNNSFALTIGGLTDAGIPVVDLCVEIMPMPGIPLNYSFIYEEVMKPIIKERNVRILCADRWNSVKILQDAEVDFEEVNLVKRQYSLKYQDMWAVKNALEQNLLIIPNIEKGHELDDVLAESIDDYPYCFEGRPVSHLALQILTVTDTGRSVLKGDGDLTDDIWRAMCLMYWATQEQEFVEILTAEENVERKEVALGYALMGSNAGSKGVTNQSRSSGSSGMLGLTRQRK